MLRFIVKGAGFFSDRHVKVRNVGLSDVLPERERFIIFNILRHFKQYSLRTIAVSLIFYLLDLDYKNPYGRSPLALNFMIFFLVFTNGSSILVTFG